MVSEVIAKYTGKDLEDITTLLGTAPRDVHKLPLYKDMISDLDVDILSHSMVKAREYMDNNLPPLVAHYKEKFELEEFPLSGYMVCNWVMAYVKSPHTLPNLLDTHVSVGRDIMKDALPDVLDMLGNVPEDSEHWQKAFSTVVIPLIVD